MQDAACGRSGGLGQQTVITLLNDLQSVPQALAQHRVGGRKDGKQRAKKKQIIKSKVKIRDCKGLKLEL